MAKCNEEAGGPQAVLSERAVMSWMKLAGAPACLHGACHQHTVSHPLRSLVPGLESIIVHSVCKYFHQDVLNQIKPELQQSLALCHQCRQVPSCTAIENSPLYHSTLLTNLWAPMRAAYVRHWHWWMSFVVTFMSFFASGNTQPGACKLREGEVQAIKMIPGMDTSRHLEASGLLQVQKPAQVQGPAGTGQWRITMRWSFLNHSMCAWPLPHLFSFQPQSSSQRKQGWPPEAYLSLYSRWRRPIRLHAVFPLK